VIEMFHGAIRVYVDLATIKEILLREGFYDPGILQARKEGQVFGLAKPSGEMLEVHIRGYVDNTLDAEIELSREYLEHPYDVQPFYSYLTNILEKYNIPYEIVKPIPPDPQYLRVPKNPIKWKPLVPLVASVIVGAILYFLGKSEMDNK
jgi:hypothetical protein